MDVSTNELHRDAKLLKLKYRREQHQLNFMYDVAKVSSNLNVGGKTGVKTRSSTKKLVKIRRPKTERFKKCLASVGSKRWNALPGEIKKRR